MSFTPFLDNLALIEVLLALTAALFAYAGALVWWTIRTNDAKGLRSVLSGLAIPAGAIGVATLILALWGEMTWPFLSSDNLGGYNIFFFDPLVLFGIVLVAYAVAARAGTKMQYVGLLALVAGAASAFYGWTGYTASPAFTKDPLDTFLLYGAFGVSGVAAFPVSVIVDYYLKAAEGGRLAFGSASSTRATLARLGQRAAQPVVPGLAPGATSSGTTSDVSPSYHCPAYVQTLIALLPVLLGLAAIAAFWYFGTTLPGHLGGGPAAAP